MNSVKGDLLQLAEQGLFDVIVHGCNCFCTMGAGIALSIKQRYPEAYLADRQTDVGDKSKLGGYTLALVEANGVQFYVLNAYTQYDFKGKGVKVDYDAIEGVFLAIKRQFSGKRIGYPMIGAGLAGGDWKIIAQKIDNALAGEEHTLVKFAP